MVGLMRVFQGSDRLGYGVHGRLGLLNTTSNSSKISFQRR